MMKKVLLVMPLSTLKWGSDNAGGVDSVCQQIVQSLELSAPKGFEYEILAIKVGSSQQELNKRIQLNERTHITFIPKKGKVFGLPVPGFVFQNVKLSELARRFQPDVIHSHLPSLPLLPTGNAHSVLTLHSLGKVARKRRSWLNNLIFETVLPAFSLRSADRLTYVGDILFDSLPNALRAKAHKVGNPVNDVYFKQTKRSTSETLRLVTCSLISPRKQVDQIIRLLAQLASTINVELKIIGPVDENYARELNTLAEELSVAERMVWLGPMNVEQIKQVYENSDVGVFLSREETFGLAPLEKLASGLPVIATEVGILQEEQTYFSAAGVHYTLADGSEKETENVLQFLHNLPVVDTESLKAKFSSRAVVDEYQKLYGELL
ncbi:VpsD family glycosyltransferase [Vibrio coralliilyticus]|uniref:VpsD family glycosyltransferase n=1 Tax=Vibrio coralliilyticus TaxID=190893 RepID=UPI00240A7364|nr:VpsD family glycosyltransferase [Vibrio coralliilyticus]WFB50600.1 VpsD family glycosyltransferase [Vibrio coralliilyticus]